MSELVVFNTLTHRKERFVPIEPGVVKMYACGPTVYDYAHLGNLRTYVFEDVLKKTFNLFGLKVFHVMNITDVGHLTGDGDDGEDKIGKAAKERKKTVQEIADFYTEAFLRDMADLNISKPDILCKASEHISDMIALIQRLERKGHTYVSGGNVYFSIDTISDYGKLARLRLGDLQSGKRVEVDCAKKNPHDFALWLTKSKFQNQAMKWDSPWGVGYPGWHIECSAMSMKYLGEHFDVHCGGVDAIPVHHTNEIAQSEAAIDGGWVNYWLHGEFLLSEKGKMSKSSGGFTTLSSLKSMAVSPLAYRYFCLQSHYRKQLQFSYDAIMGCQSALDSMKDRISRLEMRAEGDGSALSVEDVQVLYRLKAEFASCLGDDLKTPQALSLFNKVMSGSYCDRVKLEFAKHAESVFSLGLFDGQNHLTGQIPQRIRDMAERRAQAKKSGDFATADAIREEMRALGYRIKDMPDGYEVFLD